MYQLYKVVFGIRQGKKKKEEQFDGAIAVRSSLGWTGLGMSGHRPSLWWWPESEQIMFMLLLNMTYMSCQVISRTTTVYEHRREDI